MNVSCRSSSSHCCTCRPLGPAGMPLYSWPSYPSLWSPGGLGSDPMPWCLPPLWKNNRRLWKGVPDVSAYCFPCGCEHALCSLKGQVWLIFLPCEEEWKSLCGEWWVEYRSPWTVVTTRKWPGLCFGVKRRAAGCVVWCITRAESVLCCVGNIGIYRTGNPLAPPTFLL